ncbi:mannitol dehydrogenase family protein [Brucella sp. 6810]|uniref:mannitol dehydrogenase family protein n=1 Tax=Brucella sp. 6810 TaxID=2769351 RepID=UPI00165A8D08|nr:mannitol dehydrogenase family protein [Brucella sp. 6810]QNQ64397.1 mannitol dehydrogenase family protein [Brucella sp. 6810]
MPVHTAEPRLSNRTMSGLPSSVKVPAYDRSRITTGIVHLGIGAFHRAHQAAYTDAVLTSGSNEWGIVGVSLRRPDTRDALQIQDELYTLAIRDGDSEKLQVIGSIQNILVAPEDPQAVLDVMSHPDTRIVSLTITEKGYCRDAAVNGLDRSHPDIIYDLAHPATPRSALGFITEALRRRRAQGTAPFTVLSCDNLPANGETCKNVIVQFAGCTDTDLARHIEEMVAFPSTMVDRIVPATTDEDRISISRTLKVLDQWPITTEPFSQWVIEDRFPTGRPAWEIAGATFVQDVAAFELMKLRLLNGSHSTLAYLGFLAGHRTVSQTMAAPGFKQLIKALMEIEIAPTLPKLEGFDLSSYQAALIHRFENHALHHLTSQIAMDGSQKLPQRLLNTIQERLDGGGSIDRLALGVAAWMRYVTGKDEAGAPIDVRDPLSGQLLDQTQGKFAPDEIMNALLSFRQIFTARLAANELFREKLRLALRSLYAVGSAETVRRYAEIAM